MTIIMEVILMTFDNTRNDCLLDLNITYGRFASIRLSQVINDREQELDRKLSREEILRAYREIDEQLCRALMTRQGK